MDNILYTETSSKTCAEAMNWLNENNIPFKERRISKANPLKMSEIQHMLIISDSGFEEVIKRNKKTIKLNGELVMVDNLSTKQLVSAIVNQPTILRTPILINEKKMVVGFQISEMGLFIPRSVRKNELKKLL